jgi:hypothetical protein
MVIVMKVKADATEPNVPRVVRPLKTAPVARRDTSAGHVARTPSARHVPTALLAVRAQNTRHVQNARHGHRVDLAVSTLKVQHQLRAPIAGLVRTVDPGPSARLDQNDRAALRAPVAERVRAVP